MLPLDGSKRAYRPMSCSRSPRGRIVGGFFLALVLAGCAAPGPRSRYLDQIDAPSLTNLLAYRAGTNLEIRIPLRGKDAIAHASWPAAETGATNYQHRFAVLDFDPEKHAARRSLTTKTNRLVVRDIKAWQQVLRKFSPAWCPANPATACCCLSQNQEVVVFNDKTGKPGVVKLENKPPEVMVDRVCNEAEFAREAIQSLEAGVSSLQQGQSQSSVRHRRGPGLRAGGRAAAAAGFPGLSR